MDRVIGQIYETYDYEKFKKLKGNREVKRIDKIIKSIDEVGYVLSPILVNEKMEIVDGQHRFEALKEKDLPVQYMVQEGIGLKECQHLNIGQANWRADEFICSYAEDGNESYMRLYDLYEENKMDFGLEGVMLTLFPRLLSCRSGAACRDFVKSGNVEMSEEDYKVGIEKFKTLKELGYVDFKNRRELNGRSFWSAVSYAYVHPLVDMKELIDKLNASSLDIVSCNKVMDQLRYFDEAYNKRRHATNKVFMASDLQQRKYL